jgi:hypothetical protein
MGLVSACTPVCGTRRAAMRSHSVPDVEARSQSISCGRLEWQLDRHRVERGTIVNRVDS